MKQAVTPHEAMIYAMVTMSAVDAEMGDRELLKIGDMVRSLPAFSGYDIDSLVTTAEDASHILRGNNGLADMLETIAASVPEKLYDTVYAMAVEVAASDLRLPQEELRFLQMLRDNLGLSKLTVAALERSAMARYRTI